MNYTRDRRGPSGRRMNKGFDKKKVITDDYLVITGDYYFAQMGIFLMQKNIRGFIDEDGEIHEGAGVPVWVGRKTAFTRLYGGSRWMVIAQNAMILIAQDQDLRPESKNVLMYLFGRLDFENFIQVPQTEIADALSMRKQNVQRSIKQLVDKEILFQGPKIGRSSSWRLNPNYGYKGSPRGKVLKDRAGHLRLVK